MLLRNLVFSILLLPIIPVTSSVAQSYLAPKAYPRVQISPPDKKFEFNHAPEFIEIDSMIYVSVRSPYGVVYTGEYYWTEKDGQWFRASYFGDVWRTCRREEVPRRLLLHDLRWFEKQRTNALSSSGPGFEFKTTPKWRYAQKYDDLHKDEIYERNRLQKEGLLPGSGNARNPEEQHQLEHSWGR